MIQYHIMVSDNVNSDRQVTDYRLIYPLFAKHTKFYLPTYIVNNIYEYLYSPEAHFIQYVKIDLWKQCWLNYKEKQIPEVQVLLEFLFDFWGVTSYHYNVNNQLDVEWQRKNYFPGDIIFSVDICSHFNYTVIHITMQYDDYPASYFYVMDQYAYDEFCFYDGCDRYYWMFDVYETKGFHILQATLRSF